MAVDDHDKEMVRNITPSKKIVDLAVFSGQLSTDEGFRSEVQKLCGTDQLPLVFPQLPDYFKARNNGVVTNSEYRDSELSIPTKLLDSDTYTTRPELRGPMEEIIIAYERERSRQGLQKKQIMGEGWSQLFLKRLKRIHSLPVTKSEYKDENDEEESPPEEPLKGTKIA